MRFIYLVLLSLLVFSSAQDQQLQDLLICFQNAEINNSCPQNDQNCIDDDQRLQTCVSQCPLNDARNLQTFKNCLSSNCIPQNEIMKNQMKAVLKCHSTSLQVAFALIITLVSTIF
ncbi:hypothetical protein ABPG74_002696 [Tetrahymena malaccensis]